MKTTENKQITEDRGSWIIGGGTMIGVGVGFFLFHISVFFFVGSIIAGIGLGLVLAPFVSRKY